MDIMRWIRILLRGVAWLFSGLFAFFAAAFFVSLYWLAGLFSLLVAATLFPPLLDRVAAMLGRPLPVLPRAAAVGVLLVCITVASAVDGSRIDAAEQERSTRAAALLQAEREDSLQAFYVAHHDSLLAHVTNLSRAGSHQEVQQLGRAWGRFADEAFAAVVARADSTLAAAARAEKERALVAQVRSVPASEVERNRDLYRELVRLVPENGHYQSRLTHYQGILTRRQAEAAARTALFGPQPYGSSEVRRFLRSIARDPKSVKIHECSRPGLGDEGWVVACDWSAANGFGGMNRAYNRFVIRHGSVIGMR
jgi:hypothetical protein